jgi:hypothetical protein
MLVHELEDQRVPLWLTRATIEGLREEHGNWPLQSARLEVDLQGETDEGFPVSTLAVVRGKSREGAGDHG